MCIKGKKKDKITGLEDRAKEFIAGYSGAPYSQFEIAAFCAIFAADEIAELQGEIEKKDKIIAVQAAEIERLRALRTTNRAQITNAVVSRFPSYRVGNRRPYELAPGFVPDEEMDGG